MRLIEFVKTFLKNVCTEEMTVDYICGNGEALPLPLSAEEEGAPIEACALALWGAKTCKRIPGKKMLIG